MKEALIRMLLLEKFISGAILGRVWIFGLVLLQISVPWFSSVTCHQIWSLIVSRIYFSCITTYLLTLMLAFPLELTKRWHLWRFLFKRLFLKTGIRLWMLFLHIISNNIQTIFISLPSNTYIKWLQLDSNPQPLSL